MKLLNLGCGSERPSSDIWINIDDLHAIFEDPDCPERINMDGERNYLNHNLLEPLPFEENSVDGILASHLLEHFELMKALDLLEDCYRILKPGGVLRIVVPDPVLFHKGTVEGKSDWGEAVGASRGRVTTFMNYALFFFDHKQILGEDAIYCMLYNSGFREYEKKAITHSWIPQLAYLDNRPEFSLFVEARK